MKISAEHLTELSAAIRPFLHINSGESVRQRWNVLWLAVDAKRFDLNKLYNAGLNDSHIDSALRHIFQSKPADIAPRSKRMIVVGWRCNDSTSWQYGRARAAVWLNDATSHDLKRARDYVAK